MSQRANAPQIRQAKQKVAAEDSLSIPGAFPTAEPSSQKTSQRSAHSIVSARKTDNSVSKSLVPVARQLQAQLNAISSHRVQKSTSRQPSTLGKHRSHKKLSVISPKAELPPRRPEDVSLRFCSFGSQSSEGPLKRGRTRGRPSYQQGLQPYRPELSPIESPTKRLTPPRAASDDKPLNRSFSELLVTDTQNNFTGPLQHRYTEASPDVSSDPNHDRKVPDPSVFSHPGKKREGYGFSYSEPLWCDSDEYPDTECGWDSKDDEQTSPLPALSDQDNSFDDIVVVRDVGSFHVARPQRTLQCTIATREDTIRLKEQAKSLNKWNESPDVYSALVGRLERMVCADMKRKRHNRDFIPSVRQCARKLWAHLRRHLEERVETGESRRAVEHELEWATWLLDASRTGVMHIKTKGCNCQPDWEED